MVTEEWRSGKPGSVAQEVEARGSMEFRSLDCLDHSKTVKIGAWGVTQAAG